VNDNVQYIFNEHNNNFDKQFIDIEMLLNLGRQMKIPGYKVWKNVCSSRSFQSVDQGVDKINKTLYRYIKKSIFTNYILQSYLIIIHFTYSVNIF